MVCGPLARLVKRYLDRVEGPKDLHCLDLDDSKLVVSEDCIEVSTLCREPRALHRSREAVGPSPETDAVVLALRRLARARLRVYRDHRRGVKLYFAPLAPEAPWILEAREGGRLLLRACRTLDEVLEALNELGIHVPTTVLEVHDRLGVLHHEFALLLATAVPRPMLVTEARLVPRGSGRGRRLVLEAVLSQEESRARGMSAGSVYRVAVYPI